MHMSSFFFYREMTMPPPFCSLDGAIVAPPSFHAAVSSGHVMEK